MIARSVVILGGGLGGVTAATHLRRLLPPGHRIVLIDKKPTFSLSMANLWLISGERLEPRDGERQLADLTRRGIDVIQAEVEGISPDTKLVRTTAGTVQGDYLIVALGAEKDARAVAGFVESALNVYEQDGALRTRAALEEFSGGRIVILVTRTPYSCPSAPYETAFLVDAALRDRGVRGRSEVALYTPEYLPMPVAGAHVGEALVEVLREREVEFHPEQIPMKIDPVRKMVLFELDQTSYDLLLGIPPHRAPAPVRDSGLTDASGWVPVDPETLQTRVPRVFAIGDVTGIRLANGTFLPKAGVFADAEARVVAESIAAQVLGGEGVHQFDGRGFCYIDVGHAMAAYGGGTFYGMPAPRISLQTASHRFWREKLDIERAVLSLWD